MLGAAGIAAIGAVNDLSGTRSPDWPYERIAFGQARISLTFRDGLTLAGSAALIRAGAQPPLQYTRYQEQLAAVNNRTLAAYGLAGVRPANLIHRPFGTLTPREQARFAEPGVPSFRVPVTAGDRTLFYVEAPW